jgi:Tol biopolymer transport system component
LLRWDADKGEFEHIRPGLSADVLSYTPDGEWMAYVTYPEGELWRSRADASEALKLTTRPMLVWLPRYSPDGRHIAFAGVTPGETWKLHIVSHDGGRPERLLTGDGPEAEPGWSPDSQRLAFTERSFENLGGPIAILDLETRDVWRVPDSDDFCAPRWSPDGKFLVALDKDRFRKVLYDFDDARWTRISDDEGGFPEWSRDGRHIFSFHHDGVYRIPVETGEAEKLVDFGGIRLAGTLGPWGMSIDAEDRPIILEDVGEQDIYALELELP